jgi:hypothetical protein
MRFVRRLVILLTTGAASGCSPMPPNGVNFLVQSQATSRYLCYCTTSGHTDVFWTPDSSGGSEVPQSNCGQLEQQAQAQARASGKKVADGSPARAGLSRLGFGLASKPQSPAERRNKLLDRYLNDQDVAPVLQEPDSAAATKLETDLRAMQEGESSRASFASRMSKRRDTLKSGGSSASGQLPVPDPSQVERASSDLDWLLLAPEQPAQV